MLYWSDLTTQVKVVVASERAAIPVGVMVSLDTCRSVTNTPSSTEYPEVEDKSSPSPFFQVTETFCVISVTVQDITALVAVATLFAGAVTTENILTI